MTRHSKGEIVLRVWGLGGFLFFLGSAFTPLANLLAGWASIPSRLEPAEAIVVLGSGVGPERILDNGSLRRAVQGLVLYQKGFAPLLVFSGQNYKGVRETEVRAELARTLGISPEAILTTDEARTTREEAAQVTRLLQPLGIRKILLVTNFLHMLRARRVFERAGFEVFTASADGLSSFASQPAHRLQLMHRVFTELLARLYYRLAGYL